MHAVRILSITLCVYVSVSEGHEKSGTARNVVQVMETGSERIKVLPRELLSVRLQEHKSTESWCSAVGESAARLRLCQQFPQYEIVCNCSQYRDWMAKRQRQEQFPRWQLNGTPTIVVANRTSFLVRTLAALVDADGSHLGPIHVLSQHNSTEMTLLLQALQIPLSCTGSPTLEAPAATIALHYKYVILEALGTYRAAKYFVFVEDDVLVSPDFYIFLNATAGLLATDRSLYCASAHNDISYPSTSHDSSVALRTESYMNLGWMVRRRFLLMLKRLLKEYPADTYLYDWDMLAYRYTRRGRECIIPEVSRSVHVGYGGAHVTQQMAQQYFAHKNYNRDRSARITNMDSLEEQRYEAELEVMFSKAQYLDPRSKNPCMDNFTHGITDVEQVLVLFFHMPLQENFHINKSYKLLAQCLEMFPLDAREGHHGLYRVRQGSAHLFLVGLPYSRYSIHRPRHVHLFYWSEQLQRHFNDRGDTHQTAVY